jgi:hypothetical protein
VQNKREKNKKINTSAVHGHEIRDPRSSLETKLCGGIHQRQEIQKKKHSNNISERQDKIQLKRYEKYGIKMNKRVRDNEKQAGKTVLDREVDVDGDVNESWQYNRNKSQLARRRHHR